MARLSHPNVVVVHDVGSWEGQIFIAMALIDGGTLREWRAAPERSWREVVHVFELAGRGLAAAHSAGLIHRDFKPDNVLVTVSGDAYVTRSTSFVSTVRFSSESLPLICSSHP